MDLKQILIFGLLIASVWTACFDEDQLIDEAKKKLRKNYHHMQSESLLPSQASDTPAVCPVQLYQQATADHISGRSVSPWRYILKKLDDHFPATYTEAQCLCSGCILIQEDMRPVESHDYNSVPITQSKVFLKREPCSDGKYSLKFVTLDVAVGCTCARVKTSSS